MDRLKRIAAIHDLSGVGKCSLTVALPVISAAGVECACVPTAILSTHTGEFTDFVFRDLSDMLLDVAKHWKSCGIEFDGIYSGYLASPAQAEIVARIIDLLSDGEPKIIIDPVMADNGVFYSHLDGGMTDAFRTLARKADLLTPNITEAALLAGLPYLPPPHGESYISDLFGGLFALGAKSVAVTGICPSDGAVANAVCRPGKTPLYEVRPLRDGLFYGTGDIFASAMAAALVRGIDEGGALKIATRLVDAAVRNTVRRGTPRRLGVDFESVLGDFAEMIDQLAARNS